MIYGYARISRKSQNIDRQIRNITEIYPNARIYQEAFTGTKIQGRKQLDSLLKVVKQGDTIVFDSASRMSRNSDEAMELYKRLFETGINLVFIKEPHINTDTYKQALQNRIDVTINSGNTAIDEMTNSILKAVNDYIIALATEQVKIVFEQAEKEVKDLQQRTKEGIETARRNGEQIGRKLGTIITTKKEIEMKETIKKISKDFDGTLSDVEAMKLTKLSRNTYYKYKKLIRTEIAM